MNIKYNILLDLDSHIISSKGNKEQVKEQDKVISWQ